MLIGDLEIRLSAGIARLQRDMDAARRTVGDATAGMSRAADMAKTALAGIGMGMGLSQIIQMSDQYAKFTAQLRLASISAREYAAAYDDVRRISTSAQSDISSVGVLYARIANGTRELGVSQAKVSAITETVSMALKVSGATAQETSSAMLQLSQAFGAGRLNGQEFIAVNEAAPRLMKALADGMGVPIGALKEMSAEGKITSAIMAEVLPRALAQLREEAKEVQTIAGAFTVLKNNMMEFVGIQAQSSGAVSVLTGAIGLLASNLSLLAGAMLTMTAAKIGSMLSAWAVDAYTTAAANRALMASTLAAAVTSTEASAVMATSKFTEARANVAAAATASALATARVAELRTAVLAAEGAVALAITTNGLIPAQARAAALAEAHAIALSAQAVAAAKATTAAAAATAAITAQAAAATFTAKAMGALRAAVAFLGGPIGAVITLLGLAATAWMVWGNKAKEGNDKAVQSTEESTVEMIARLDKQIKKLQERNVLMNVKPEVMGANPADVDGLARAYAKLNEVRNNVGEFAGKPQELRGMMERIYLRQYSEALGKVQQAQKLVADAAAGTRDVDLKKWFGENGTNAQKLAYELEGLRKKYGELPAAMEASVRAKYADKGAATAIKQEATAYQSLITSIGEKIAAGKLEMAGYDKLSDAQKMTIKLDEAIASGKNKLTPKHIAEARAMIATVAAQDASIESHKAMAAMRKDYSKVSDLIAESQEKSITSAVEEAEKNEELARTFDMTKGAIEQLELARLEGQLAQRASTGLTLEEIETLEKLIDAKKRSAAALGRVDELEAAKKVGEEWKRQTEKIEESLTEALMRGFESGKGFGQNLIDTLKNMFGTLVLRPIISAIVNPVAGVLTGAMGVSGAAQAASGAGSLGSAGGILSGIGAMSGAFGGGIASGLSAWGAGGSVTGLLGSGALFGGGIANGLGLIAGALGPIALGIGAAVAIWKKFDTSGTYHTGGASSASAAGTRTIRAESLGFEGTRINAETEKLTANLASGIVGILDSTATAFGKTAGYTAATAFADDTSKDGAWGALMISKLGQTVVDWDSTRTSRWAPKEFADGEAGQAQYLAALSASVRTALNGIGLPGWAQTMLDGLSQGASIEEIAKVVDGINATKRALVVMGNSLTGFAQLSDRATSALIAASGGIEALAGNASAYYDAFYSDAEKTANVVKQITEVLTAAGVAMPATRDAFRAQVEAQMALGEAGAPAVAALLKVAGAFAQTTESAAKSAADITSQRVDLQNKLDQLTMTSAQLRAKERLTIDASNRALFDQINARQDIAAAYDRESSAMKTLADNMKSAQASTIAYKDSLSLGGLSILTPIQRAMEAQRQYEASVAKARANPTDGAAYSASQTAATAWLTASQIINASSDAQVANVAKVQADMSILADIAGAQLTDAQMQMAALDKQVEGILTLNQTAIGIEEAIRNLGAAGGPGLTNQMPAPALVWSEMGTSNMAPLAAEIKTLNAKLDSRDAEIKLLREEMTGHFGALITATHDAADRNAEKTNDGAGKVAKSTSWQQNLRTEAQPV